MKFAIKKATGVLVGAALALMLNTKGFAEELEPQEDLISPVVLESQIPEEDSSVLENVVPAAGSGEESAQQDEKEGKNISEQAEAAADQDVRKDIPSDDILAEDPSVNVSSEAAEEQEENSEPSEEDAPILPDLETVQTFAAVPSASDDSSGSSDTGNVSDPAAAVSAQLTVGSTEITGSTTDSWSADARKGWFYSEDSDSISMVNAKLDVISATGRDVSLVTAGVNQIDSLKVESGNINVIGTGILLIKEVDIIGEEYTFNLLEYSNDQFSSGSVAVFLWDSEQDAYVLANGSIAGILDDDNYFLPDVKLIIPEDGSVVLTTTKPENIEVDTQGSAARLTVSSGAELVVAGNLSVQASAITSFNQHLQDPFALSRITVQGTMSILSGANVHLEGELVIDGGILDCQEYITSGYGQSWDEDKAIPKKGYVVVASPTGSSVSSSGESATQKNSTIMVDSTNVLVKSDKVTIDKIDSTGNCTLALCGGDQSADWTLTVGDVYVNQGNLNYSGYVSATSSYYGIDRDPLDSRVNASTLHVTGSISGSGTFCPQYDIQIYDNVPDANVNANYCVVHIPSVSSKITGNSLVMAATSNAAAMSTSQTIPVDLLYGHSSMGLEHFTDYADITLAETREALYLDDFTHNENNQTYAFSSYSLDNGKIHYADLTGMQSVLFENVNIPQVASMNALYFEVLCKTDTGYETVIIDSKSGRSVSPDSICRIRAIYLNVSGSGATGGGTMGTNTSISTTGTISSGVKLTKGSNTNRLASGRAPSQSSDGGSSGSGGSGGSSESGGSSGPSESGGNGGSSESGGSGGPSESDGNGGSSESGGSGDSSESGGSGDSSESGSTDESSSSEKDSPDSASSEDNGNSSNDSIQVQDIANYAVKIDPEAELYHYSLSVWEGDRKLNLNKGSFPAKLQFSMPKSWDTSFVFAVFRQSDGSLKAVKATYDAASGTLSFTAPQTGKFLLICFPYDKDFYTDAFYSELADWIELMS